MATSTSISLCSSLTAHCRISQKHNPSFNFSTSTLSFPSIASHKLPFSPLVTSRPAFPPAPKSSESEAAVVEAVTAESVPEPEPETALVAEVPKEKPKREEIFAVVMIGSRQYIVFPGRFITTQRLKGANVNDKIVLNKVLLVGTKAGTYIGAPVVTNAVVHAVVEEQGLDAKKIVFKYKRKKNYRRKIGHRQPNTRIRIMAITGYENFRLSTIENPK